MRKNLLQDIKIKRLSPSGVRRAPTPNPTDLGEYNTYDGDIDNRPKYKIWLVVIVSSLFFLFAISYLFLRATVTVNPKTQDVNLTADLSASSQGGTDALPFDLIVIPGEEERAVEASEQKDVAEKARGVVIIYNAFSSASQRLDIETRLEGSNGKIYKTDKALVVPGMKGSTPGSVVVGIHAAEAGAEYNSGPLDFTIFGFKGTPKYSKFYAISNINDPTTKGEIKGGFQGKTPFVSETQKGGLVAEMKAVLQAKLFKQAIDQIPAGFVLFPDAIFVRLDENQTEMVSVGEGAVIKLKGTLYGAIFNEEKLAEKVAETNIDGYEGNPVYVSNIRDLNFSLKNKESISLPDVKNINFSLLGAAKIVYRLDEDKLVAELLGKPKKNLPQILSQYPNIESANLTINPFWKKSLPDKSKDIKIIVNYPK